MATNIVTTITTTMRNLWVGVGGWMCERERERFLAR